jgi:cob(I)alamin adenosyltransferase
VTPVVLINRIYTKTGDDGTTALATGERRPKSDLRFETIGTIDELNAHVGLARLNAAALPDGVDAMLGRIQNDLFDLGADLATPEKPGRERLRIVAAQVERLESEIDALNADLAPLTSFVLPGGTPAAAALHLCRTVARRAERLAVSLAGRETVNPEAMRYINRLSDFFFVAARLANDRGAGDVLWVPGENR